MTFSTTLGPRARQAPLDTIDTGFPAQNLIMTRAPIQQRGGTLSAFYLVAYLMQGVMAFLAGAAATHCGLDFAVGMAALSIAFLSMMTIILAIVQQTK